MTTEKKKVKKTVKKVKKTKASSLVSQNLAAKVRPRYLEDFIGQEAEVKKVKGWFKNGRLPSTILLKGTTGSGKTTLARIIAIYANCEKLSFCGKCASCKAALEANFVHPDVVELNMGENGGKESILGVIQSAQYRPRYRKRVVLLDESHLLTSAAESSLLVPTEEPPADTIFIFCTTDPQKMNKTILNRCAQLDIRPILPEVMVPRLLDILKGEVEVKKPKAATKALEVIAENSEGQMRLAISMLDSVVGMVGDSKKGITVELVEDFIMNSGEAQVDQCVEDMIVNILGNDLTGAITAIRKAGDNARPILHKSRFIFSYLIGEATETNRWSTAQQKSVNAALRKNKIKYGLPTLIKCQEALINLEVQMNSCTISDAVLMETAIGSLICHDYFKKD